MEGGLGGIKEGKTKQSMEQTHTHTLFKLTVLLLMKAFCPHSLPSLCSTVSVISTRTIMGGVKSSRGVKLCDTAGQQSRGEVFFFILAEQAFPKVEEGKGKTQKESPGGKKKVLRAADFKLTLLLDRNTDLGSTQSSCAVLILSKKDPQVANFYSKKY